MLNLEISLMTKSDQIPFVMELRWWGGGENKGLCVDLSRVQWLMLGRQSGQQGVLLVMVMATSVRRWEQCVPGRGKGPEVLSGLVTPRHRKEAKNG